MTPVIDAVMKGFNGTICAYGQTGMHVLLRMKKKKKRKKEQLTERERMNE